MARPTDLTFERDPLVRRFRTRYLPRIRRAFRPSEVWLFGSRVRGDAMMESDLDVVVVSNAFVSVAWPDRAARVLLAAEVTDALEILCYTPSEFDAKKLELGIVQAAVEEGRRVHPLPRPAKGRAHGRRPARPASTGHSN